MFFFFIILGLPPLLIGIIILLAMSKPMDLAMRGIGPAVLQIEALLAFIIAAICFTGAGITYILARIASLLKLIEERNSQAK
jgi:regulator of sirC expression with transglutaminase-like and TPR domain